MKSLALIILTCVATFSIIGCASNEDGPQPEHEKLSAMPHNFPSSWEGQAGMGAAFNQYE